MVATIDIVVFGTDPQTRNHYLIASIADAFRKHPKVARVSVPTYASLVRHCADAKIDILLAVGGAGAIVEPLRRAIKYVRTSVLWTTEDPYELDRNLELSRMFDCVITNDINALQFYPLNARHLPFAASSTFHDYSVLQDPKEFLFDLFFVGTAWPERVDSLNTLLSKLPRSIRKKIGLSGNPHLPNFHIGDLDLITNFRVAPREFARMANRSIVTLTLDRSFSSSAGLRVCGGTPPPRLFELALAGTAQVYMTARSTVQKHFAADEELLIVSSIEEAAEAIQMLLSDRDRRAMIAAAARGRALTEHLYSHRASAILEFIGEQRKVRSPAIPSSRAKRILMVSHNVAGVHPFGGIELYQETQAHALSNYEFFVLYFDRRSSRLSLKDLKSGTSFPFEAGPIPSETISDPRRESIFGDLIARYNFDLIHFHHLIGHALSLPMVSRAFGVPSVYQMHDYYGVCSEFNLLGIGGRYCGIHNPRVESCDICLSTRGVAPPGAQMRRRWVMSNVLSVVDAFVHNCEYTRRKITQIYPDLDPSLHHVIGMTARLDTLHALNEIAKKRRSNESQRSERLQVAILGNFTRPKGGDILMAMFWQTLNDPIDFNIMGRVDMEFGNALQALQFANVIVSGLFDQDELPYRLREMHVSVHFSIWPETYCIGLDEARAAGLVPIVLGYGALAERVRDGIDGIVIDSDRPYELIQKLRSYCVDRSQLERMRYEFSKLVQGYSGHFAALDDVYQRLFSQYPTFRSVDFGENKRPLLLRDIGVRFSSDNWRELKVDFDRNPEPDDPLAIKIEQNYEARVPNKVGSLVPIEAIMRPGDELILLMVDEFTTFISHEKFLFVPRWKRSIAFGVGIPVGLDRSPLDIFLVGRRIYRTAFERFEHSTNSIGWSTVLVSVGDIEPDVYSVVIGFIASDQIVYYGTGVRIVFTSSPISMHVENELRSVPWQFAEHLPGRFRYGSKPITRMNWALKALVSTLPSKLVIHVDSCNGIQKKNGSPVRVMRSANRQVTIIGWVVPRHSNVCFDAVVIRLVGDCGAFAERAILVHRPDVVKHFGKKGYLRSGIEWTYPLERLASGSYQLEFVGVDSQGTLHSGLAGELIIE